MKIKEIRTKLKISQKDLAEKVGILPTTLYKYENGIIQPNIETLMKIADALSTNVDTIIGFETPMLDLRKLTSNQQKIINAVLTLNPDNENKLIGYIDGLKG